MRKVDDLPVASVTVCQDFDEGLSQIRLWDEILYINGKLPIKTN